MYHIDLAHDVNTERIIIDSEVDTDRLGWKSGDHFKLVNKNGVQMLIRVDPIVAFISGYKMNDKI